MNDSATAAGMSGRSAESGAPKFDTSENRKATRRSLEIENILSRQRGRATSPGTRHPIRQKRRLCEEDILLHRLPNRPKKRFPELHRLAADNNHLRIHQIDQIRKMAADPRSGVLQDGDGRFYLLMKSSLLSVERKIGDPMPVDFGRRLSSRELADVVAYMEEASR